jgi:hypothetical protein
MINAHYIGIKAENLFKGYVAVPAGTYIPTGGVPFLSKNLHMKHG